jgi:hypothetical protein
MGFGNGVVVGSIYLVLRESGQYWVRMHMEVMWRSSLYVASISMLCQQSLQLINPDQCNKSVRLNEP